nr:hypothetical protein CFP56_29870 [Quercus suber]
MEKRRIATEQPFKNAPKKDVVYDQMKQETSCSVPLETVFFIPCDNDLQSLFLNDRDHIRPGFTASSSCLIGVHSLQMCFADSFLSICLSCS